MMVFACGLVFAATPALAVEAVWFDELGAAPQLSDDDKRAIGSGVWEAMTQPGGVQPRLPDAWQHDTAARIVFVSAGDRTSLASVGVGAAHGLAAAIRLAAGRSRKGIAAGRTVQWVRIDVVNAVLTVSSKADIDVAPWSRNITGLASRRAVGMALLAEELVANRLVDHHGDVRRFAVATYLLGHPDRGGRSDDLRPWHVGGRYRFTTTGAFCDEAGPVPLTGGRRFSHPAERRDFQAAARLGGRYLARCVADGGRFVYEYRPYNDSAPRSYNILRHAGSVYALLEAYEFTGDKSLLDAAGRALDYLVATVQPMTLKGKAPQQWVVERGYTKLGGNALAVLALTKHATITGDKRPLAVAQQLAAAIVSVQDDDGRFTAHKIHCSDGRVTPFVSEYYPGEAIFALAKLYELDKDQRWLEAAARSASYLIKHRDLVRPIERQIHDHWLLYGLNELYRHRPDAKYLAHTRRILKVINKAQHSPEPFDDWHGGYYVPPRSTPASTRAEGVAAAFRLLSGVAAAAEAALARDVAHNAAGFALRAQLWPESAMFFTNPQSCLGGVQADLIDSTVRIDFVQHAISCWLAVAKTIPDDKQ